MGLGTALALIAGGVVLALALWVAWARTHPSPFPYSQRLLLEIRPYVTLARLRRLLEPRPGERLLEVGPGIGHDAVSVAEAVGPHGSLDVLDAQQEMLERLMRRARERGVANITPTRGDAGRLPYPDATFDGAYLVTVLGEVADQAAALRELSRVLKPDGHLVVGELALDPHFVSLRALRSRAEAAGFHLERRTGVPVLAYLARFSKHSG
jgi:SAM-dependent methyltransferase